MTELPDLRQVRSLVAVAETESFTKAAERLNVTQSAVSHSIRALETQLEVKLVERSGKRLALTQEGAVLLRRFRATLKQLEMAGEDLALLKRWGQGRLRVGATNTLCHYLLPEVLLEFRKLYPRCEIHLESGDTSEILDQLEKAEVDLVLGIGGRCPTWARFDGIFQDEMVFVFSKDHAWAQLDEIDMAAVESQSFLVYAKASETYRLLKQSFESAGGRLRSSLRIGDMGAIMEMAKLGIGVAIVAPWAARREIEKGELISLPLGQVSHQRDWGSFCYENRQLSMVEEDFLRICRKVTREFPGVTSLAVAARSVGVS